MMMPKPMRLTKIVRKMMRSGRVIGSSGCCSERLSHSRALPVAHRRMIEVPEPDARRVDQLANPGHLVELDLRDLVGVRVVVGMERRGIEDDRNALHRVAVVIAPRVHRFGI